MFKSISPKTISNRLRPDSARMTLKTIAVLPWWPHLPTEEEVVGLKSIQQRLKMPLICVLPDSCATPPYVVIDDFIHFSPEFFSSPWGYSRLLLTKDFYDRFFKFQRILIVQSDVLLLKDITESLLVEFDCDYIGAPWVSSAPDGKLYICGVGNGGFSLRNIAAAQAVLSKRLSLTFEILRFARNPRRLALVLLYIFLTPFRIRAATFAKLATLLGVHEDVFWSRIAHLIDPMFRVATQELAAIFAVEREPAFIYAICGPGGPLAAHAWLKHGGTYFESDCAAFKAEPLTGDEFDDASVTKHEQTRR